MSLFTDVMEGYIGTQAADTQLDAATEADIEARITDDAFTVSQYTGECFYEMMACEAAMYAVEGRCSVNYMAATTESAKAEVAATMEASLSGAINKIKELASRAWEAVKKFIKKVWQKIKGFAATLRNSFKKFAQSIDREKIDGLQVKWQAISPEGAYDAAVKAVMNIDNRTNKALSEVNNAVVNNNNTLTLRKDVMDDFRDKARAAIYGSADGYDPKTTDAGSIIAEAIKIADLGYDKFFNNFLAFGEKKYKDYGGKYKQMIRDYEDKESDDEGNKKGNNQLYHLLQGAYRMILLVIQEGTQMLKTAIQQKFSLAVKACRAAVRYSHGDKTATTKESYTNFDETLARIL